MRSVLRLVGGASQPIRLTASTYFMPQLDCLQQSCATECGGASSDACRACMADKCTIVALACLNHTCGG